MRFTIADLDDLARGAAFLGTGGGGDPYVGRLMATQALRAAGGACELMPLAEVPDDAQVISVGNMGAPTVLVEKIPNGREPTEALRRLEAYLGRKADALIPFEAGGVNSTLPLLVAAQTGLPVLDADGMGRAAAVEVMTSTAFIRDCIIDKDKTSMIPGAIATGTSQYGMQTFDQAIFGLYSQGTVTLEEALRWASNVDDFKLKVSGISTTTDMARDEMASKLAPPPAVKPAAKAPTPSSAAIERFGGR